MNENFRLDLSIKHHQQYFTASPRVIKSTVLYKMPSDDSIYRAHHQMDNATDRRTIKTPSNDQGCHNC